MEFREARQGDSPAIRDVVRRSLQASYSLDAGAITAAIEEWYDNNRIHEMLHDNDKLLLVAEADEQIIAFSDSQVTGEQTGELFWLHVDPDYRGHEVGQQLFEATRERLAGLGGEYIHGRVLGDNVSGNEFYERQGLQKVGEEEVDIAGTTYVENVYAEVNRTGVEPIETEDGETVYLDRENQETGSVAPFYVVYTDETGADIWGYYCSKCDAPANAMDAMGRIQCDECGNARKPTRWDSAYL
ncbi:MAG: GNAT family N-acetyltransferase [Haloarculaceae archaeon]